MSRWVKNSTKIVNTQCSFKVGGASNTYSRSSALLLTFIFKIRSTSSRKQIKHVMRLGSRPEFFFSVITLEYRCLRVYGDRVEK